MPRPRKTAKPSKKPGKKTAVAAGIAAGLFAGAVAVAAGGSSSSSDSFNFPDTPTTQHFTPEPVAHQAPKGMFIKGVWTSGVTL